MPAYFDLGFSVREPMWHGLGEVLKEYPGREDAIRLAGHDFTVQEEQVYLNRGIVAPVPGWKALTAQGGAFDGKLLQIVPESYAVVQNDVLWDISDAIAKQDNVRYETAGVLKEGAVLWVLFWLDEPVTVTGDDSPIYPFGLASTTHDGSGACKVQATSIRVVCWNTFSAADEQARKDGTSFTFRHTKNVMARIEDAKVAIRGIRVQHEAFLALSEELAAMHVSESGVKAFIESLIPFPISEMQVTDRVARNIEEARSAVLSVLSSQTTADAHKDTAYGLFQAGIEHLDHLRRARSQETYFTRSLIRQERAKTALVTLAREVAAEYPA